ncbi:MAG: aldo/keto reductase [Gaiellaceae bacterium]
MTSKTTPPIALGAWSWGTGMVGGDQVFGNSIGEAELRPVFDEARAHGLNLWDTAPVYGMGSSETILGSLIKQHPGEEIVVSTKFTPQVAGDAADPVAQMASESCERLGVDVIDLYWIHNPADVEKWTPALIPLLEAGTVKRVGVSNHNLDQIKRVEEILSAAGQHLSAVQNHYSLLYRSSEDAGILDYCREKNIEFFAYMVLEQGALAGVYGADHPMPAASQRGQTYNPILPALDELTAVMRTIGEEHGASVAQVAIAWALAKGATPLIGVTKPRHVSDAARAAEISLNADEVTRLEAAASATGVDTKGAWENAMA